MNKKAIKWIFIVCIIGSLVWGFSHPPKYKTLEEALKHNWHFQESQPNSIITTLWMNENAPITLYIDKDNNFCRIEYKKHINKHNPNVARWTIPRWGVEYFPFESIFNPPRPATHKPLPWAEGQMLYGIQTADMARRVRINGEPPQYVEPNVVIKGEEYTVWYVMEDIDPYKADIRYADE